MIDDDLRGLGLEEKRPELALAPANPACIVTVGQARFSVLTPSLIRMEYAADGHFRDEATQVVVNRSFAVPEFTVTTRGGATEILTADLRVTYRGGRFRSSALSVSMRTAAQNSHFTTWRYGVPEFTTSSYFGNLGGTARTLDDIDGPAPLEAGIISTTGFATLNDSGSLPLTTDGWVAESRFRGVDIYFFGYGLDHQAALRAFFELTGPSPLLPRKALGNWWSRFYAYTADEYVALMDSFRSDGVPISVAVIDMDWHHVDVDRSIGSGWTGYSWNRELFPNPERFLGELRRRGLLTTLNVHPADGVRRHEDAYADVARALGQDPQTGDEVPFDIADRKFADAYFKYLHHPQEEAGVDFWWVDWQSGTESSIEGLDPLWMLNFLHYTDNARQGKRPLTFSRYAGPGSHRYPVGFSGDSIISWRSFAFQPYFTATAANIGYFWWSHDIGGHMMGVKDSELATRWLQFGVFSPIMRLHSSSSIFTSKEPRSYGPEAQRVQERFLRLRHQLLPYLYTAMWKSHTDGVGPVRPMYHDYPAERPAYEARDQYMFGPDMIVAPITAPREMRTGLASSLVWLPGGHWTDVFTGLTYRGGRALRMYRSLDSIPVLVRAGSVLTQVPDPMAPVTNATDALRLVAYRGPGSRGELIEDDGASQPEASRLTWSAEWAADSLVLRTEGEFATTGRNAKELSLALPGCTAVEGVRIGGRDVPFASSQGEHALVLALGELELSGKLEIGLSGLMWIEDGGRALVFALLDSAQIAFAEKEAAWEAYESAVGAGRPTDAIAVWSALDLPGALLGALIEVAAA